MKRAIAVIVASLTLASCGRVADLQPQAGRSLPQKPALASRPLTAEELLALPPMANPDRFDELNKRGDVREPDRFDLPPPGGEALSEPALNEPTTPDTTGPDNQEPDRR